MIGNILVNKGIGGNKDIVSNGHITCNRRVNTEIYAVTNRRDALSMATVFLTDGATLMDVYITTQLRTGVNCDAVRVTNIEAFTNLS